MDNQQTKRHQPTNTSEEIGKVLHLTIKNREQILLDTPVKSVSSVNKTGLFDILFQHAHFISIIQEKIIIRYEDGRTEEMAIDQGIVKVRGNQIDVYLGIK